jgi:hypothetical protein
LYGAVAFGTIERGGPEQIQIARKVLSSGTKGLLPEGRLWYSVQAGARADRTHAADDNSMRLRTQLMNTLSTIILVMIVLLFLGALAFLFLG